MGTATILIRLQVTSLSSLSRRSEQHRRESKRFSAGVFTLTMTTILSAIVWILSLTATAAGFTDFLLDDGGRQRVKERLLSWHTMLDRGDWRELRSWIAAKLDQFLAAVFGERLFSMRALWLVIVIAAVYAFLEMLVEHLNQVGPRPTAFETMELFTATLLTFTITETVAILLIRLIVRWSNKHGGKLLTPLLALLPHVGTTIVIVTFSTLLVVVLSITLSHFPDEAQGELKWGSILGTIQRADNAAGIGPLAKSELGNAFYEPNGNPISIVASTLVIPEFALANVRRKGPGEDRLFFVLPVLSSISLLLIVFFVYVVSLCPRWLRAPMSLLVERMANAPKGAFSAVAVGLASLSALLKQLISKG
jgi:hypothetical protein